MTQEHPITPPPELVHKWIMEATEPSYVPTQAARWGSDQELEACRLWVSENCDIYSAVQLIQFRRPKPPSLKAGAIEVLDELDGLFELPAGHYNTILRALEQLDD